MKQIPLYAIEAALKLTEGRYKKAAMYCGVGDRVFFREMKKAGVDWRDYRKPICSCGHTIPRCESCKRQNRDSMRRCREIRLKRKIELCNK